MVLLDLFQKTGFRVAVAHANFQLRGEESQRDEDFVRTHCSEQNIPFHAKPFDTAVYAKSTHQSIQMAARELRYRWFDQLAKEFDFLHLATAHHAGDFTETVILQLSHQQGIHALTGIPLRHGRVIRPMLFATRDEIERYATEQGICWREDETNQQLDYERNKIRHRVVPALKEINPSLEAAWLAAGERAQGDLELIHLGLTTWRERHVISNGDKITIVKSGVSSLAHPAQALSRLLESYGFNYAQCVSLVAALDGQSGKLFYSASHQLLIDRQAIVVEPFSPDRVPIVIAEGQSEIVNGTETLSVQKTASGGRDHSPFCANLDAATVQFPLTWRSWQPGDRFVPLGMTQSKKVSDFLIDQKISRLEKANVSVLESGGNIVWLVGYRVDDRFKVKPATQSILRISLSSTIK